ncbi:MAG: hypothetical protein J5589_02625 [Firmicutes bacterium]|nr:hypothetical protein [Bacillota bacterium]
MLEGLPGTGKSTNSYKLYEQMIRNGKNVHWLHEVSQPHPTLFFTESCLSKEEYHGFIVKYPEIAGIINEIAQVRKTTVGIDYEAVLRKCQKLCFNNPKETQWFQELMKYDAFPTSLDRYEIQALEKWEAFAKKAAQDEGTVYILDSCIFQYQIFTYLLKDAGYDRLSAFVQKILACLSPLDPLLIYLYRENTEDSIAYLQNQRGMKDLEHTWERDKEEPYYTHKQKDVTAFYDFLKDYTDYAARLFDELKCDKKKVEISENNWKAYEDEMLKWLQLDRKEAPAYNALSGRYVNSEYGFSFTIENMEMTDPEGITRHLSPRSQTEFYVEGLPTILEFFDEKHIRLHGQQIIPQWTETGMIYEKAGR